ncbi:class I SAM-dependent methyltransferase [Streptomyces venezuelae ATCC 10712]
MTPRTTPRPADGIDATSVAASDTASEAASGASEASFDASGASDVFEDLESYDDVPERLIGYPAVFHALGIGSCAVRTVLDYGCGPGKVATRVVEASDARVVAVDLAPRALEIARERRPHPRIEYRATADGGLGFLADGSVDAAMACFVFTGTGRSRTCTTSPPRRTGCCAPAAASPSWTPIPAPRASASPRSAAASPAASTPRASAGGRAWSGPVARPRWSGSTTTGRARRTSTCSARRGSPTWTSTSRY